MTQFCLCEQIFYGIWFEDVLIQNPLQIWYKVLFLPRTKTENFPKLCQSFFFSFYWRSKVTIIYCHAFACRAVRSLREMKKRGKVTRGVHDSGVSCYSETGCSFDGNLANFCRNIDNLIDSLSGESWYPCKQVAQFILYLVLMNYCDFQNVSSAAVVFWG